jgi:hypothetical protein
LARVVTDPDGVLWWVRRRRWYTTSSLGSGLDGNSLGDNPLLGLLLLLLLLPLFLVAWWPLWFIAHWLGLPWRIVIGRAGVEVDEERVRGWLQSRRRIRQIAESAAAGTLQEAYAGQAPRPAAPRNGLGIAALVLAIIGLLFCWSVAGGVILGVVAVSVGFTGRGRVKWGEATNGGVAMAGIVLGFLSIIAGLVCIVLWFGPFKQTGEQTHDLVNCMAKAFNNADAEQQCRDQFKSTIETQFSITPTTP